VKRARGGYRDFYFAADRGARATAAQHYYPASVFLVPSMARAPAIRYRHRTSNIRT